MDLQKAILREHSRKQALKIADYVGNSPFRFKQLVQVFTTGPYRVTQRSSWPLSLCIETHPGLLMPHFKDIMNMLSKPGAHDAVKRNIVRLLQFTEIPARYRGIAAEHCFKFLNDPKEPIAVRVFSMTVLANLTKREPDLKQELKIIIEDHMPYGSAAFLSRARKVLREL